MTQITSSLTAGTTLARVRGWLFDVDGVLHVASQPISGAAELLAISSRGRSRSGC